MSQPIFHGWHGRGRRRRSLLSSSWPWSACRYGNGIRQAAHPRRGILGLDTTRGDRLFISLLGSAFILLAWLGIIGTPLWGGLALSLIYAVAVFRWV